LSNLLAVCYGNKGQPLKHQTCDERKGKVSLHINPQSEADVATISYSRSGIIKSSNKEYDNDLNDVLNLNDAYGYMVNNRKEVLAELQKQIYKKFSTKKVPMESWQGWLKKIQSGSNGKLQTYCGILCWYLQKKIVAAKAIV
jgi:hypothetical protein